jgi:PPOX class probable F420-dependent enzyme
LVEPFLEHRVVLLETLKRDGTWVGTPVLVVVDGPRALIGTPANAGKVKRMRNFSTVRITACTMRGRTFGPTLQCEARRLTGDEATDAERRLRRGFPVIYGVLVPVELAIRRVAGAHFELTGFSEVTPPVGVCATPRPA